MAPETALHLFQRRLSAFHIVRREILDVVQANKLQRTVEHLKLFETPRLSEGDVLPPAYHQAFFTPEVSEAGLTNDGGDPTFNPPGFPRRMWAGGNLSFSPNNRLRVGQAVTETTTFERVDSKMTRSGSPMLVVWVRKRYENDAGLALEDRRSWLFRPEARASAQSTGEARTEDGPTDADGYLASYIASEILLFRFSALTFNAHRIHYDLAHTQRVEGHPHLLVHAPLNILLLANMWREAFGNPPEILDYRAISPCYVGLRNDIFRDTMSKRITIKRADTVLMEASGM
ncbi:hypothetical protein PYCC9005_001639 [Savitreella phatthalungensis]